MKRIVEIAKGMKALGIESYYVGGYVRDYIMGVASDDIDIVLVGKVKPHLVQTILDTMVSTGDIDSVTKDVGDFPVWNAKIGGLEVQFAMARVERKTGDTRQDFACSTEDVTIEMDLYRRDYTINAIAMNIITEEIVDPYGGIADIAGQVLRHVSPAFSEDTLRVYRLARFAAQLPHFSIATETYDLCRTLFPQIPAERVGKELMKVFERAPKPSRFFTTLESIGWLNYHFPELQNLIGVPQSKKYHPEGDAFVHTMHCLDAATGWFHRAVMLCHDLGKSVTTEVNGFKWHESSIGADLIRLHEEEPLVNGLKVTAIDHEKEGVPLTRKMLQRISFCKHSTIRQIGVLVELHMVRAVITDSNRTKQKIVRRYLRVLMEAGLSYNDLIMTVMYDLRGRPPLVEPDWDVLYHQLGGDLAQQLVATGAMEPVVTGDMLIAEKLQPGPRLGEIVKTALKFQDRGTLNHSNWRERLHGAGFKEIKLESHG